jgi:transcriptional regulator
MLVPSHYQVPDPDWVWEIIQNFPLALLMSNGSDGYPIATHLPVVPGDPADFGRDLRDVRLLGHMNRANRHWRQLAVAESVATVAFVGPGFYISPALYMEEQSAPTWNFVVVHLVGNVLPITDRQETLRVVSVTASQLEGRFGQGWSQAESREYFHSLAPGVGAFYFDVLDVTAMFKLSQERTPEVRHRIAQSLREEPSGRGRGLAEYMQRLDDVPRP